jgi:hypothetical protein
VSLCIMLVAGFLAFGGAILLHGLLRTETGPIVISIPRSSTTANAMPVGSSGKIPQVSIIESSQNNHLPKPVAPVEDTSLLALQLRSGDPHAEEDALQRVRSLPKKDPRSLVLGLPDLLPPLLTLKQYNLVEQVTIPAIEERSFDPDLVEITQRARVDALMGEGKELAALSEAKRYYDVVSLSHTGDAVAIIASLLRQTAGLETSSRFQSQQFSWAGDENSTTQTLSSAGGTDSPPTEDVLRSVAMDSSPYGAAIKSLKSYKGSHHFSFRNLMGLGNLLLLQGNASEARQSFETACKMAARQPKDFRWAVEGIARALRDEDDRVDRANAFVLSLRKNPQVGGANLIRSRVSADDLRGAAQRIMLAELKLSAEPQLEFDRARLEPFVRSPIAVEYGFDCSVPMIVQEISPTHFHLAVVSPGFRDWFLFRVRGAAGKVVRFDITTEDPQTAKWTSLNPMYSYVSDLGEPEHAVSAASPIPPSLASAWNGPLIPGSSAGDWHYCPYVWMEDPGTLSFVHRFEADTAYIAMRVPYTPDYNERYLRGLASNPIVKLIEIGRSATNQPLLLLMIDGQTDMDSVQRPCILVYAGEHADEHDAPWAVQGAIEYLLSSAAEACKLREQYAFLFIPELDPHATSTGTHQVVMTSFLPDQETSEAKAYANWFQHWVQSGRRLDLVLDLHNVQSNESTHLACALMETVGVRGKFSDSLHAMIVQNIRAKGFDVTSRPWMRGWMPDRLGGWLSHNYGPLTFLYELNSQSPDRHLSVDELRSIGAELLRCASDFLASPPGKAALAEIDARRRSYTARWTSYHDPEGLADAIQSEADRFRGSNDLNASSEVTKP